MRLRTTAAVLGVPLALALQPMDARSQEGFLFGPPRATLTLRAGPMFHSTGGDLFDFFRSQLTLERADFRAVAFGGEVAVYRHPRLDLALGIGVSSVRRDSEFRNWEDDEGLPIRQVTTLRVAPLTASAKVYLLSRGERISPLVWIPARTSPYIGGGAGLVWYSLRQVGEFVAVESADAGTIFADDYRTDGAGPSAHALLGIEHWLNPRFGVNVEGRYIISSATPGDDFTNWDRLDLGGWQVGIGVSLRW